MIKKYEKPIIEAIDLYSDIIRTSGEDGDLYEDDDFPEIR